MLEGLGWTILRIWSTDWFRDSSAVVERLHAQLEKTLVEFRAKVEGEKDAKTPSAFPGERPKSLPEPEPETLLLAEQEAVYLPKPEQSPNSEDTVKSTTHKENEALPLFASVTETIDDLDLSPGTFFDASYLPTLRTLVDRILAQQAPIPFDVLARKISRLHGWQRTGRRINDRVEIAALGADEGREDGRTFLWQRGSLSERSPFRGLNNHRIWGPIGHSIANTAI